MGSQNLTWFLRHLQTTGVDKTGCVTVCKAGLSTKHINVTAPGCPELSWILWEACLFFLPGSWYNPDLRVFSISNIFFSSNWILYYFTFSFLISVYTDWWCACNWCKHRHTLVSAEYVRSFNSYFTRFTLIVLNFTIVFYFFFFLRFFYFFFYFLFWLHPRDKEVPQGKEWIQAEASTYTKAAATLDPQPTTQGWGLSHCRDKPDH